MLQLVKQIWISKDVASAVFLAAIAGVALWIIALPFNSSVQEAYLKRFHLATPSYVGWSVQQIVPTMYNFENRYWFRRNPVVAKQPFESLKNRTSDTVLNCCGCGRCNLEGFETGMLNHFPTRKITFGDARSILNKDPNGFFYLSSKYRGREIRSVFQMKPLSDSEIQFQQLEWTIE